ncbi:MAG: hypothetical protein GF355_16565 [Candidatus Eisenbacteria bacterium]|nr:hypothetical protein [Candidatus Eisenbacteria bacterium]
MRDGKRGRAESFMTFPRDAARAREARRNPSGYSRNYRASFIWLVGLAAIGLGFLLGACEEDLPPVPETEATNVVTAFYLSTEDLDGIEDFGINGEALDAEWGGPLQEGREYSQIRLSAAHGAGDPGPPLYVSMKAMYTEEDLFLLFQWPDLEADERHSFMRYVGPDLPLIEILCGPEYADTTVVRDTIFNPAPGYEEIIECEPGGEDCDTFYVRTEVVIDECDTTFVYGCREELTNPDNWEQFGNEDRLAIAFQIEPVGDERGAYAEQGCLVACHPSESPAFGRPAQGRLDVWHWLASRTNPVRDLYRDTDNPEFPQFDTPGYLDDMVADPSNGLVADPGLAAFARNFDPGSTIPTWIYRCEDDVLCEPDDPNRPNAFGERARKNNGVDLRFLWREDRQFDRFPVFTECDTINEIPLPIGSDPRYWRRGDTVPGYVLTYPEGSRADVHGKGVWEEKIWTLEVARPLATGDAAFDVQMRSEAGFEILFTLAIMDNSRTVHWGSEPQILRFGLKE